MNHVAGGDTRVAIRKNIVLQSRPVSQVASGDTRVVIGTNTVLLYRPVS